MSLQPKERGNLPTPSPPLSFALQMLLANSVDPVASTSTVHKTIDFQIGESFKLSDRGGDVPGGIILGYPRISPVLSLSFPSSLYRSLSAMTVLEEKQREEDHLGPQKLKESSLLVSSCLGRDDNRKCGYKMADQPRRRSARAR